jgi:hypothetical protein
MTSGGKVAVPRQRGTAAVEFALILPAFLLLLVLPLGFGRVLWHYTAVQKAAQDAARYVSSLSANEMNNATRAADAEATARAIVAAEIAELNPGNSAPSVSVQCDALQCDGLSLPDNVTVGIRLSIEDIFFPDVAQAHVLLTVRSTLSYSGN